MPARASSGVPPASDRWSSFDISSRSCASSASSWPSRRTGAPAISRLTGRGSANTARSSAPAAAGGTISVNCAMRSSKPRGRRKPYSPVRPRHTPPDGPAGPRPLPGRAGSAPSRRGSFEFPERRDGGGHAPPGGRRGLTANSQERSGRGDPDGRAFGHDHDRSARPDQAVRAADGGGRPVVHRRTRTRDRLPGPERRREVHHDADDPGAHAAHERFGAGGRPGVRAAARPPHRGGRPARRRGPPPRPAGCGPPARDRAEQRHPARPRRRGAADGRPGEGRPPQGGRVLARDAAAARHRGRAARRPPHPHLRRAGERPRPGGHPLDPRPDAQPGRRGARGAVLQPPDERDGPHRRPPDRHRPRAAPRRHGHARVRPGQGRGRRPRPRRGAGRAGRQAHRRRRRGARGRGSVAPRVRPARRRDRPARSLPRHRAQRADPADPVAGGRLHGDDEGPRRLRGGRARGRRAERSGGVSTRTAAKAPAAPPVPRPVTDRDSVRFGDLLRSEWVKFRSLRSLWWTLLAMVTLSVTVTLLVSSGEPADYAALSAEERREWDPTGLSLTSFFVGQLAVCLLGVLTVTSEYATGTIRTSLAAMPRRGRLLAAKTLVLAGVALAAGQVTSFACFLTGQAMIGRRDGTPTASLADPGVPGAVIGIGLYLA